MNNMQELAGSAEARQDTRIPVRIRLMAVRTNRPLQHEARGDAVRDREGGKRAVLLHTYYKR